MREANVYSEIHAFDVGPERLRALAPKGIVLSGGPKSVNERTGYPAPDVVFELGVPVLGICYGMQSMAARFGGEVETSDHREFGYAQIRARGHSRLLAGIEESRERRGARPCSTCG